LHSAINGTVVPHAHSDGLDFAAPLHFARPNGLSGMLSLDFQQGTNALKALKALVKYLVEREEALYAISTHDGAARVFS
jgi:oxepin-CoA hydrolase/3-oxo-5,6-dehydrosuberyl-CoA semialdehyde dehydrogenase